MENDLIEAKKYLSEQGYGSGTNYTTNLVAVLLSNYVQKQVNKFNKPAVSGSFYWVRPFDKDEFEPAKCKDRYGDGKLYFCFTNGRVMEVESACEVEPLNKC